jgi:hypothetical protein
MPETGPASPSPGLCGTCAHARVLYSDRGAQFYRCALSDTDPRYARYPRLPVVHCDGYDQTSTPVTGTTERL